MYRSLSLNSSTDSEVFYVEPSSSEKSPIRNNTPAILNSTQLSGAMEPEAITISTVASPEPQIVTIDSDSNEPIFLYAFCIQHPVVPPSLNDLNLPPNPFKKGECLFLKKGECRSTSARHAANPFQTERHPNAQRNTQTLKLLIRLLTNYFYTIFNHYAYTRIRT